MCSAFTDIFKNIPLPSSWSKIKLSEQAAKQLLDCLAHFSLLFACLA
jgi:hypothetical protein